MVVIVSRSALREKARDSTRFTLLASEHKHPSIRLKGAGLFQGRNSVCSLQSHSNSPVQLMRK